MFRRKKKKEEFKKVNVQEEEVPEENPMSELTKESGQEQPEEVKEEPIMEEKVEENPIEELTKETEKEIKPKEKLVVVKELPMQPLRYAKAEDGTIITYVTMEEALTELMKEEEEE